MILTKNKTVLNEKHKTKFKKSSFIKKSIIGGAILFSAIFSWEVSVTLTNSINISNRIDASIDNFAGMNNYDNFKTRINNTPYTEQQFQRDLKLFGYIFENNNTPLMQVKYGKYELYNFMIDRIVLKNENIDKTFLSMINESNKFKNENIDITAFGNKKYSNFFKPTSFYSSENEKIKSTYRSALFRFNGDHPSMGDAVLIDNTIYENIRKLIKEEGLSEDALYIGKDKRKEYMKALAKVMGGKESYKNEGEYMKALDKLDYDFYKEKTESLNKIKEYYKNGNYEKIRRIFKVLNGFSVLIFDDIVNKNNFETYGVRPSYIVEEKMKDLGLIEKDKYDEDSESFKKYYIDDARKVAKIKGTYNQESKKYYNGEKWLMLNY